MVDALLPCWIAVIFVHALPPLPRLVRLHCVLRVERHIFTVYVFHLFFFFLGCLAAFCRCAIAAALIVFLIPAPRRANACAWGFLVMLLLIVLKVRWAMRRGLSWLRLILEYQENAVQRSNQSPQSCCAILLRRVLSMRRCMKHCQSIRVHACKGAREESLRFPDCLVVMQYIAFPMSNFPACVSPQSPATARTRI